MSAVWWTNPVIGPDVVAGMGAPKVDNQVVHHNRQPGCRCPRVSRTVVRMERSGPALAPLAARLLSQLVDAAVVGLAERGFEDVRPVHDFALRAIAAGADSASELGRSLSVSKQAAAKTIATLVERGYLAPRKRRPIDVGNGFEVTPLGFDVMRTGESIIDDLRERWRAQLGDAGWRRSRPNCGRSSATHPYESKRPGWVALELDGR